MRTIRQSAVTAMRHPGLMRMSYGLLLIPVLLALRLTCRF